MHNNRRLILIFSAIPILIGVFLFVLALKYAGWDFSNLGSGKKETNVYEFEEAVSSISIETDTADIEFLPADDEKIKVVAKENENLKHTVTLTDGVLLVKLVDTRAWYEHIAFFNSSKITVYLPTRVAPSLKIVESTGDVKIGEGMTFANLDITTSTGDVKILSAAENVTVKCSTGDVYIKNATLSSLNVALTTGDLTLASVNALGDISHTSSTGDFDITDTVAKNLISSASTGNITMKNLFVEAKIDIKRSTGDVEFVSCDSSELSIKTSTGDVSGSFLSNKIIFVETDTGEVDVPRSTVGGICDIETSTGDVTLSVKAD